MLMPEIIPLRQLACNALRAKARRILLQVRKAGGTASFRAPVCGQVCLIRVPRLRLLLIHRTLIARLPL